MLSVDQALDLVERAATASPSPVEVLPLAETLGRVLAEDVHMDHDVPPFRRAAMDGYAVPDGAPVGARYRVAGRVAAGEVAREALASGRAMRVMTGAPVPAGTARVVPFEASSGDPGGEGDVEVLRELGSETHVVETGAHVRAGALVLTRGSAVSPAALGVLAAAGRAQVRVSRRPSVAVLGTGSELVAVSARPGPAQIRNSNNPTLLAQAACYGAAAHDLGCAPDEAGALSAALARGLEHEVLLVSGGVSRGDLDLVPGVLASLGVVAGFHGWRVQPGGPLWFGTRGETLVFALPGNPAASFVGFEVLVRTALRARLGCVQPRAQRGWARWRGEPVGPHPRRRYRPVGLSSEPDGGLSAQPRAWKGSGDPFALAQAQALCELPEEGLPAPGLPVRVLALGGGA